MNSGDGGPQILRQVVPPITGVVLLLLFVKLGFWQLDRASQKVEMQQAFDQPARYVQVSGSTAPDPFQAIRSRGQYLGEKQIIIENIVLDGALGYYVITPFEFSSHAELLLVNRGWIRKTPGEDVTTDVALDGSSRLIRGKTGHLPRVGIRPGVAFLDHDNWPRMAVWPTAEEVAAEIGRNVLPFVLLLDPQEENGFVRRWQPKLAGPSTHYGYAFQWFVMAIAVLVLIVRNLRKRTRQHDD